MDLKKKNLKKKKNVGFNAFVKILCVFFTFCFAFRFILNTSCAIWKGTKFLEIYLVVQSCKVKKDDSVRYIM